VKYEVPFYGQNWNVEAWRQLGFKSQDDAQYWKESACGILCFKMAADALLEQAGKEKTPPLAELIQIGVDTGAYTHEKGWIHKGLVDLAAKYGLEAELSADLNSQKLRELLDNGALLIVSIKWAFKSSHTLQEKIRMARDFGSSLLTMLKLLLRWEKFGGHLALVVGYNSEGLYVNHPSTSDKYNWQRKLIPTAQFMAGFTGRGIAMYPVHLKM